MYNYKIFRSAFSIHNLKHTFPPAPRQKYGTASGINQMGTHNVSENGRGAWVALCDHPTHTDTDTVPPNAPDSGYSISGIL
jgi:hypothetical protein